MNIECVKLIITTTMCGLIIGCADAPSEESRNGEVEAIVPNFTLPVLNFRKGNTKRVQFGISNCEVYKNLSSEIENPNWELLFKPEPYPLPQQCIRERLEFDGEYIQIEIATQALGAGGCCTNYAAYRSRDGKNWEIRPATSITEWQGLNPTEP